jgi:gas vesicle protein
MNNAIKFWAVFAVGVAAGAAVALIYAPQSGEKTRRQLRRGLEDAGDYLKDAAETLGDHAEKYVRRGKDLMDDVVDSASNAVSAAKKVVQI